MKVLIRGGRVVDPHAGRDAVLDVLIEGGKIARVGENLSSEKAEVFDAAGLCVFPGFIDLHVHLREPGFEYRESISSGTAAAAAGGFTAVCAMANTSPVNDHHTVTRWIVDRAREAGSTRVYPIGAITKGLRGEELAEFGEMKEAGAVAVSDDGRWVANGSVMRRALEYAGLFDLPVATHAEDETLSCRASMNEGAASTRLGLSAQPGEAESTAVARDIALCALAGGRLHVCHLSTAASAALVRDAKAKGLRVTAEVTPHHLFLTDRAVGESGFSPNTKVNPPLRTDRETDALAEALADGTIDAVATDHAPHHPDEKAVDYESAPFGMIGLETAVALVYTKLVATGRIPLSRMVELFTSGPARAFSLPGGSLAEGREADVTVFDPSAEFDVDPRAFRSRSRNTPFSGWKLSGRAAATFVSGREIFRRA
ncbi:MAG: dihydroorotase [Thermoanaerobaculia bacterium]